MLIYNTHLQVIKHYEIRLLTFNHYQSLQTSKHYERHININKMRKRLSTILAMFILAMNWNQLYSREQSDQRRT